MRASTGRNVPESVPEKDPGQRFRGMELEISRFAEGFQNPRRFGIARLDTKGVRSMSRQTHLAVAGSATRRQHRGAQRVAAGANR